VQCPTCSLSLVKGDGCDSVYCFCGTSFSWSVELANTNHVKEFAENFPNHTAEYCARVLCLDFQHASIQSAAAWRNRNQTAVQQELLKWWARKYDACPSQVCLVGPLVTNNIIEEARNLWASTNASELAHCTNERKSSLASVVYSIFPDEHDRLVAASRYRQNGANVESAFLKQSLEVFCTQNMDKVNKTALKLESIGSSQFLKLYGKHNVLDGWPIAAGQISEVEENEFCGFSLFGGEVSDVRNVVQSDIVIVVDNATKKRQEQERFRELPVSFNQMSMFRSFCTELKHKFKT